MAQVVENLPRKGEVLSSNPSTAKTKNNEKKKKTKIKLLPSSKTHTKDETVGLQGLVAHL
jgi:hypothetical protein